MIFPLTSHTIRYVSTENQQRIKPYDSIRAAFWEGKELYNTAGFKEKNHIQICIRDPKCIIGYFLPRQ